MAHLRTDGKDQFYLTLDLDENTRKLMKRYRRLIKKVKQDTGEPIYLEDFIGVPHNEI